MSTVSNLLDNFFDLECLTSNCLSCETKKECEQIYDVSEELEDLLIAFFDKRG